MIKSYTKAVGEFIKYRMQEHRKPPKPAFYDTHGKGSCRYCGEEILKADGSMNKRASWHKPCVAAYRLVHFPRDTRKAVWARDKGRCYLCDNQMGKKDWELEHKQPLYLAEGQIEFWELSNLGTACRPCHKEKTAREASDRAAARRSNL